MWSLLLPPAMPPGVGGIPGVVPGSGVTPQPEGQLAEDVGHTTVDHSSGRARCPAPYAQLAEDVGQR